jgi:hypothetical protein
MERECEGEFLEREGNRYSRGKIKSHVIFHHPFSSSSHVICSWGRATALWGGNFGDGLGKVSSRKVFARC